MDWTPIDCRTDDKALRFVLSSSKTTQTIRDCERDCFRLSSEVRKTGRTPRRGWPGAREVEIVSDSELLVKQMLGVYRVKHPNLVPMHAKAKALVRKFARFTIRHTLRAGNKDADRLANLAA